MTATASATTTASVPTRSHQIIQILGILTGSGQGAAALRTEYAIPNSVMKAAYHNGIWDVTALLPYIKV